ARLGARLTLCDRRRAARRFDRVRGGAAGHLACRVAGAKPAAVCRWIFTLLGAGPGDTPMTVPRLQHHRPGMGRVRQLAGALRSMAVNYPRERRGPTRLAYLPLLLTYALPGTGPWALMARTPRSHDRTRR